LADVGNSPSHCVNLTISSTRPSGACPFWQVIRTLAIGKIMPKPNIKKALGEAIAVIYFDDSSDYSAALWAIVEALNPEAAKLLEEDLGAAYDKYSLNRNNSG